jgi:hypothetical protein
MVPISVLAPEGDIIDLVLRVDLARFFTDGTTLLDLSEGAQSHGEVEELLLATKLSDLAVQAINPE